MNDKITIIIPVHNGAKYLKKLYKNLRKQTYANIEIIFVENFSVDNSLNILNEIAVTDDRIKLLECKEKGTSLARRKGVEHASGKYIVFMDQDDWYVNNSAIADMHKTICETKADICQFNVFKYFGKGIKRKTKDIDTRRLFSANDIREKELGSVFEGFGGGYISTSVWSKMYSSDVLKDAVQNVNYTLYVAEDLFLNTCCLLSDKMQLVCVDPNAYYVWDTRFGFSKSKDSGLELIKDYAKVKPIIHNMLIESNCSSNVMFRLHIESLYYAMIVLKSKINSMEYNDVLQLIDEVNSMEYIRLAKSFMNQSVINEEASEELRFLSSDYTPKEFYDRYYEAENKQPISIKKMIKSMLR